ncbi:HAMP domain-containing sensor histidine kinase [Gloeocapsopsis dulcis]|uniref:Circadian input-output histidine kinase CikA n=1 Tax=Gloeocapsopsis dulcis AAB1 = 1H9 TaxID=1433147 RepID=A0A6N8FU60_9CHRO|nr:hybrid sensor histidine kinase/response regulator [Gloeocapsopsis dulcis]MUL36122.1 two-component sensor histidine kinase [Gloeocapsopsis dulcis AAB1 = 1H9]WNN91406.1 ATP-binding protein [Gloeocapsopsis dulcis]
MAKPGQSLFRRILLSRILLLSVPVLLIGEAVAYRKARSILLETARQNLTESAIRKSESIEDAIAALKAISIIASQTQILQTGTATQGQQYLNQLAGQLPDYVQCVRLVELQTQRQVASTCGNIWASKDASLPETQVQSPVGTNQVNVTALLPSDLPTVPQKTLLGSNNVRGQLHLRLSTPVYTPTGQPRYTLSIQASLGQQERTRRGSLTGYTVVISQNGTILAHPLTECVGRNIQQEPDAQRLQRIVEKAIAGRQDMQNVSFAKDGVKFLAGYSAISSPITNESNQSWTILAVTRLDNALYGLREIKIILIVLTVGLLGASLLATRYLARDLARPLERLRDYALNLQSHHVVERVPHNFKIREFQQLAEALERMVERLTASAEEIETAWEEAQAANQLKSEFLATTSHELRTPLNAIIGCIRLVRDGCCDDREEEMEFLLRADEAAIHLLSIINDVLDVAKIEAGKLSVILEPTDLRQLLKEVINLQTVHIQQKGLQLVVPQGMEPIPVQADPAKLKQVLLNVIGNAVKFTEQGSIIISTRLESVAEALPSSSQSRVVITVEDTGVGIDPALQHKLFRPFVMVDGTTTRKFGGTGLGLAISRNLIELMGGTIALYSAGSGQGTTVAITMPVMDLSPFRSHHVLESRVFEHSHPTSS